MEWSNAIGHTHANIVRMPDEPAFAPMPGISRTRIDRAGDELRRFWSEDSTEATPAVVQAYLDLIAFRETFQVPLNKTVVGLRSMVRSEWPELDAPGSRIPVVQRLKRREQMIFKLTRLPASKLSNMGDIGGCRAILQDWRQVDGLVRRIRKNWNVQGRIRDTRHEPAPSGYRGVHVIVVREGRRIEIQLRVPREHEWALAVERTGNRLDIPLKEGLGPADLKEYFRLASLGMYLEEIGADPPPALEAEFEAARERVRHYF
jgi:putative GTP pyrophosphokinase